MLGLLLFGQTSPVEAQDNLLTNPGFEGQFSPWNNIGELQVAAGWTPWWIEDPNHDPTWARPEWKKAEGQFYPNRVREGATSQQYFTFYKSHYGGMYQQVSGVTPGTPYRFGIWVQIWSSLEDDPLNSVGPGDPRFEIGIDPTGAANAGQNHPPASVVWTGPADMWDVIDRWHFMAIDVTAESSTITVYIRSNPQYATKHNDIYLDAAQLISLGPPPTNTPAPTNTPWPTNTPTNTPIPPTSTPVTPTNTPTNTPIPPTNTPVWPTNTPWPTATSVPPTNPPPQATAVPPTATLIPPPDTPIPATDTPEPTEEVVEEATQVPATDAPPPTDTPAVTNTPLQIPTVTPQPATVTPIPVVTQEEVASVDTSNVEPVEPSPVPTFVPQLSPPADESDPLATVGIVLGGAGLLLAGAIGGVLFSRRNS